MTGNWPDIAARVQIPPCKPPFWARGGHAQTLVGHFVPSVPPDRKPEKVEISLPDGDRLAALHYKAGEKVCVSLFHGLGGSTEARYMSRVIAKMLSKNWSVLAVNHRGCGIGRGMARGIYHSGRGEDIGAAVAHARKLMPEAIHVAIGFSLSGNALLVLVTGKRDTPCRPDLAISVNAPINLAVCAKRINTGFNKLYQVRFAIKLQKAINQYAEDGFIPEPERFSPFSPLMRFDDRYTAPRDGFADRHEYYRLCSTYQDLAKVDTPAVILTAADDPMLRVDDYRAAQPTLSPKAFMRIEKHGGHLGYFQRGKTPAGDHRWMDHALQSYIEAFLSI